MARGQRKRSDQLIARAIRSQESGDSAAALNAFEKILKREPGNPGVLRNAGIAALHAGKPKRGIAYLNKALARNPADPAVLHSLGAGYFHCGDFPNAVAIYSRLVEASPGDPSAHLSLGTSLCRLGRLEEARAPMQRALDLDRDNLPAINNLGSLLLELGHPGQAMEVYRRGLDLSPDDEGLRQNYAAALSGCDRHDEAVSILRELVERASNSLDRRLALARGLGAGGRHGEALTELRSALGLDPDAERAWLMLAATLCAMDPSDLDQQALMEAAACMTRHPTLAPRLSRLLCRCYRRDSAVIALLTELGAERTALVDADTVEPVIGRLGQAPFIALLEGPFLTDPEMERVLTVVRRWSLQSVCLGDPPERAPPGIALLCALVRQCFEGEYVFMETPEESAAIESLRVRLSAVQPTGWTPDRVRALAILACYRPLYQAGFDVTIDPDEAKATDPGFAALLRLQVEAPREEAALRSGIRSLTPITDPTSRTVGDQYEASPYPRWRYLEPVVARPLRERMLARYPYLAEWDVAWSRNPQILVAGCGTGRQAIRDAQLYAGARVLAMDLSLTSLGYAARQAEKHDIGNIEFVRGDILELAAIDRQFDLVTCTGVLHHLADPERGWRLLLDRLRPGGLMQVGLYSVLARRSVTAAREFATARGWTGSVKDIRDFRCAVLGLPKDHPVRAVSRFRDFYALSECRDLVFHPQEVCFDIPRIRRFIDQAGLRFVGFDFADPALFGAFRHAYPEPGSERSLDFWERFEDQHPDTFAGMYVFWVMKGSE